MSTPNRDDRVRFLLDGREVAAGAGQTVMEAGRANGVEIPSLCHHPALEPYGACRLCVVEVETGGRSRLVTSCNYEVRPGLKVLTRSPRVANSRRMTLELLLARCPGVSALQELGEQYGVKEVRFPRENEDCILCGLCVRICRERMGPGAADFVGRGADIRVDTPYRRGSEVCLSCGACESVCPTHSIRLKSVYERKPAKRLSEFEAGLMARPSIYIPFPQALPNAPVIDRDNCVHFRNGTCGICQEACPAKAIDYEQQDRQVELEAGALILAPGFCLHDASVRPELGFTRFPNVINSLQFERILSASGPTGGKVLRPSDWTAPRRIAFIQCVGSREQETPYCSSVCCMYALKEAVIAKEHDQELSCEIFYMDLRAHGKGFDAYAERANSLGVILTPCRPSRVDEIAGSRNLTVGYSDEAGRYGSGEFELVVLSAGLKPPREAEEMARRFGISLNGNGFARRRPLEPASTSREGVFACGPFVEPKDIPETVTEASSASALSMALLAPARGSLVKRVEMPPERDLRGEPPRIGVFVCHCGFNIGGVVDVPGVAEYARSLPFVVYAADNLYTCSSDTQKAIRERIAEHRLNRVVVASCSPRTHEPLFQQTIREAGLNPHLFEMANIRDQCSWVHMHNHQAATAKARDLVRMAVAKARLAEPLKPIPLPVTRRALVVGGGLAGMACSLSLADQGFETVLVEKADRLGGHALKLSHRLDGLEVATRLAGMIERVSSHPLIRVHTSSRVAEVEGFVGNFVTTVAIEGSEPVRVEHGVAVIASGGVESSPQEYLPEGAGNGSSSPSRGPRVLTLLQLNQAMGSADFPTPAATVMIQCVGSREPDHLYCSRVCCAGAVRQAIRLKERDPGAAVYILYRDLRAYGFRELEYARARELGVIFIRYTPERKPRVGSNGERLRVRVFDPILRAELEIGADLLVLSARVDPNPDNLELARKFKVPLTAEGFFLEAHAKLRPVEFATDGVFLCGLAHYPKDVEETFAQALAAAGRAATVLSRERIEAEGKVSRVIEARCSGCGACVSACAYKAISMDETRGLAVINEAVCKGCGACAAACRAAAIDLKGFQDAQILKMLRSLS